jgi:DNA (cytosine-5)-methyltransferase 1
MKDIVQFFRVVQRLKPRFWAMENVPRVADVIRHGAMDPASVLYPFRHLINEAQVEVFDFSDFGTPQSRKRCIAGNIPFELLSSYQKHVRIRTLGEVVSALANPEVVIDPVWGTTLSRADLTETQVEPHLNAEELRMNREAKEFHPVYNNMAFPDPLDQPARTVTATCTRVSRESIVIEDPAQPKKYRRLTIRERASLQGFPITYQFYAKSFAEKAKMVGNAVPPSFTYLLGLAAQEIEDFLKVDFSAASDLLHLPTVKAPVTVPDSEGRTYPETRSFRAAVPGLRFKSGMRFELANARARPSTEWEVRFFFGSSKDIREIELDGSILRGLMSSLSDDIYKPFWVLVGRCESELNATSPDGLQSAWTKRGGGLGPFAVVDMLGELAEVVKALLSEADVDQSKLKEMVVAIAREAEGDSHSLPGESKLRKYALDIVAGMIVGDWFNTLGWHQGCRKAA